MNMAGWERLHLHAAAAAPNRQRHGGFRIWRLCVSAICAGVTALGYVAPASAQTSGNLGNFRRAIPSLSNVRRVQVAIRALSVTVPLVAREQGSNSPALREASVARSALQWSLRRASHQEDFEHALIYADHALGLTRILLA